MTDFSELQLDSLKKASRLLRSLSTEQKNQALHQLALALKAQQRDLLEANKKDLDLLASSSSSAFRDRLTLSPERCQRMEESLHSVIRTPDPVGEITEERTLQNGLRVQKVRSPLGVILMIFESRPNVTLEAFSLAFKSGNAIALRGGSESRHTCEALYQMIETSLKASGISAHVLLGIKNPDRSLVSHLLTRDDIFDVVVPRGGSSLIQMVQTQARMPLIKNDRGLCHTYVHRDADLDMAIKIVNNAKTQRPGVCNSLETVLVHSNLAEEFILQLYKITESVGLVWKADERTLQILKNKSRVFLAKETDWDDEHLDQIINCKIVDHADEAFDHIEKHGSRHSEAIVTSDEKLAQKFLSEIDAAATYWNASTRFTDGFELGLGGELGISTQKLHVRGPVGLKELTSVRWLIFGQGQIR